jgi:predicted TIM-barrel fold metal-dependent hydrolase
MIIDADCHISSRRSAPWITGDDLVERMDRAGVDRAVVWLSPPYDRDLDPELAAVHQACRTYPDRLIGFGWANPRLGAQRTRDHIKRCFEEYGFWGIKFNGAQDGYVIDDPELSLPHIELAAGFGKPIAFHIGADFYENTHPYRLGRIAARFPEIRFLASHMGGAGLPSLHRSCIEVAREQSNVYLIGSNIAETAVLAALQALGPERVCFGSDEPYRRMDYHLAGYQAMLRDVAPAAREKVLGGNLARIVGLAPEAA